MTSVTIRSHNLDNIEIGSLNVKWSARGDRILRYYVDVRHKKLNIHKEVSAPEIFILQSKLDALMANWDEKFDAYSKRQNMLSGQNAADELSTEAAIKLDSLQRILAHTLKVDDKVDWETLKDKSTYCYPSEYPEPRPSSLPTTKPEYQEPRIGLFEVLWRKKAQLIAEAEEQHSIATFTWEAVESKRKDDLQVAVSEWEKRKTAFWSDHYKKLEEFEAQQAAANAMVDSLSANVANGEEDAVIEHASLVMEASNYDGLFEKSYLIQYDRGKKLLKIAYDLPSIAVLPSVKSVKFIKASGELRESFISDREKNANFESVAYQICLRSMHELFEADENENLQSILFNGFVNFVDPATGQEKRSCLLSVLVDRSAFSTIDLSRIDPKTCFKSLKGVSAATLSSLAPIPPVMEMDTEDRRFIEARAVGSGLDQGTNLASISWEDFEHLVRELFDKEFAARGGEVKVTQSSSDGGVDAVAFDPDPITGGKIVIQAKRYTRTVGVSAVRDLFGTVMNEGASRGILVTTADYGPDAYNFANGKPITLMNGANLLHMLERHGYAAKIDLAEARSLIQ
jgi:restriction system protein